MSVMGLRSGRDGNSRPPVVVVDGLRGRVKGKDKAESQTPYYVYAEAKAVEALIIKW